VDFEWDPLKAASNLAKHGVDFDTAAAVFDDPDRLVIIDDRRPYGEQRYQSIGLVAGVVLFVAYAIRGEKCRIISARKANRHEREAYALQA
jgi:uncharacterized protein